MRKKKLIGLVLIVLVGVLFSGCGSIGLGGPGAVKKTTVTTTDPTTLATTTTVTEEPASQTDTGGFFKSENLEEHYRFETERVDKHEATAAKKVSAITDNVGKIMALDGPTATEKLLTGVIANMQIAAIPTSPGPSGVPTPKTGTDVLDKNIGNLGMLTFGVWDRVDDTRRSSDDDSTVNIENSGDGMVFYQSDHNNASLQATKYTLGDSTGEVSLGAPDHKPTFTPTDSNDSITTSTRTDSNDSSSWF